MRANQIAEFSYIMLIAIRYPICAQVGVVQFDKSLKERTGSKKLLLKQREVEEVFASGRDLRPAMVRTSAMVAFCSINIVEKSFSELQIRLE